MYHTPMQNLHLFKKEIVLLCAGLMLVFLALFANFNPVLIESLKSEKVTPTPTPTPDPSKDLKSLDNYLDFTLPVGWKKTDYLDTKFGKDTIIKLTTTDFDSPEPTVINGGVGIVIDRTYDLKSEETLSKKLNQNYGFETYNVMPLTIDGKNAMTMHQDGESHHRYIYIAAPTHLWEITVASKSLEDESRYDPEIENFLKSIKFK